MLLDTNALSAQLGDEVWLVGKGRSIDTFSWESKLPYVCINESVFICPKPTAVLAVDARVLEKLNGLDCVVMKNIKNRRYSYKYEYQWNHKQHANITCVGSGPIALQVLHSLGVRIFHLIGFDSLDGDNSYSERVQGTGGNKDNFKNINKAFGEVMEKLCLKLH